jgi:hypothetical protein
LNVFDTCSLRSTSSWPSGSTMFVRHLRHAEPADVIEIEAAKR